MKHQEKFPDLEATRGASERRPSTRPGRQAAAPPSPRFVVCWPRRMKGSPERPRLLAPTS